MINSTRHYSEWDLCALSGKSNIGVVSITEPDRFVSDLDESKWASVLRLYFHDIDRKWQNYALFTIEQADQIIDWLQEHEESLEGVYVHCAAGISRSAAVAKFISDVYGLFFDHRKGALFNRHVYRVLRERIVERGIISVEQLRKHAEEQPLTRYGAHIKFTE